MTEMPPAPSMDSLRARRDPDTTSSTVGALITDTYQHFLDLYGDPEIASVATSAVVVELLTEADRASLETP